MLLPSSLLLRPLRPPSSTRWPTLSRKSPHLPRSLWPTSSFLRILRHSTHRQLLLRTRCMLQRLYVPHKTIKLTLVADFFDLPGRLEEQCHWFDYKYQCRLRESYRSICLKFSFHAIFLYSCTLSCTTEIVCLMVYVCFDVLWVSEGSLHLKKINIRCVMCKRYIYTWDHTLGI